MRGTRPHLPAAQQHFYINSPAHGRGFFCRCSACGEQNELLSVEEVIYLRLHPTYSICAARQMATRPLPEWEKNCTRLYALPTYKSQITAAGCCRVICSLQCAHSLGVPIDLWQCKNILFRCCRRFIFDGD